MKTIVVTGGAGFIGSHLCEKLVYEGNKVICIDNLFTGNKDNIDHLIDDKNFRFLRRDIIDEIILDSDKINQIYNLACPASPSHYQHNPVRTMKANVMGSINMLGMAKRHGTRILQASTSEVYGDPEIHPQVESYRGCVNPIGPRACYDEGKRAAETLFFDYHREHDLDIRVVRIFNTYGPRMAKNDGRVVSNFIIQALKDDPITIYGNGDQTRSFCYIDDLITGIIAMMNQDNETGPINLGNTNEFTIKELAKKIIQLTGSKSQISYKSLPEDDPKIRQPDITLAKKILGWEPQIQLNDGLKDTINYFRSII